MRDIINILLSASAVGYLWVSSYKIVFTLAPSAIFAGIASFMGAIYFFYMRPVLDKDFKCILKISYFLLIWAFFIYLLEGRGFNRRLFQIGIGILVAFTTYIAINSFKYAKIFILYSIFAVTISSIVGVGQFLFGEPFINLYLISGKAPQREIMQGIVSGRITGLSTTQVSLSYELVSIIPFGIIFIVKLIKEKKLIRSFILALFILINIFALILTQVRSAIAGLFLSIAFIYQIKKNQFKYKAKVLLNSLIIGLMFYFAISIVYNPKRFIIMGDVSAKARLPMQLNAILYSIKHPLGLASYRLEQNLFIRIEDPEIEEVVSKNTPHNQFLNVLVYYGYPGIIMIIFFYLKILKNLFSLLTILNGNFKEHQWIILGLTGSILAFLINSMFHNSGPFVGNIFHWYFIGMFYSVKKIVTKYYNKPVRM